MITEANFFWLDNINFDQLILSVQFFKFLKIKFFRVFSLKKRQKLNYIFDLFLNFFFLRCQKEKNLP